MGLKADFQGDFPTSVTQASGFAPSGQRGSDEALQCVWCDASCLLVFWWSSAAPCGTLWPSGLSRGGARRRLWNRQRLPPTNLPTAPTTHAPADLPKTLPTGLPSAVACCSAKYPPRRPLIPCQCRPDPSPSSIARGQAGIGSEAAGHGAVFSGNDGKGQEPHAAGN